MKNLMAQVLRWAQASGRLMAAEEEEAQEGEEEVEQEVEKREEEAEELKTE